MKIFKIETTVFTFNPDRCAVIMWAEIFRGAIVSFLNEYRKNWRLRLKWTEKNYRNG